jgi:DNA-binding NarL/FixJ family response regulator
MTVSTSPVRLLLADPQTLFREGLRELLKRQPRASVVAEAVEGSSTLQLAADQRPDVILLDPELPGLTIWGLEVCRELKKRLPSIPILMVARSRDLSCILESLRAGAAGYVTKDLSFDDLWANIEKVCGEGDRSTPFLARPTTPEPSTEKGLSRRESQILSLVALGKPNKEIGRQLRISEHTVRNHISNIFSKLQVNDRTQAAVAALQQGLISPVR